MVQLVYVLPGVDSNLLSRLCPTQAQFSFKPMPGTITLALNYLSPGFLETLLPLHLLAWRQYNRAQLYFTLLSALYISYLGTQAGGFQNFSF